MNKCGECGSSRVKENCFPYGDDICLDCSEKFTEKPKIKYKEVLFRIIARFSEVEGAIYSRNWLFDGISDKEKSVILSEFNKWEVKK